MGYPRVVGRNHSLTFNVYECGSHDTRTNLVYSYVHPYPDARQPRARAMSNSQRLTVTEKFVNYMLKVIAENRPELIFEGVKFQNFPGGRCPTDPPTFGCLRMQSLLNIPMTASYPGPCCQHNQGMTIKLYITSVVGVSTQTEFGTMISVACQAELSINV